MTTGNIIKRKLGLEGFKHVRVTRVLGAGPLRILMVYFDSHNVNYPVTASRIRKKRRTASVFSGGDIGRDLETPLKYLPTTPLMHLEDYAGNIGGETLVIPVDLSGDRYIDSKAFSSRILESYQGDLENFSGLIRFYEKGKEIFCEGITIKDLMKNQGLSDFTDYYAKERSRVMGSETKATKLLDISLDKKGGWVQFDFLSEATEKYPTTHRYKEVDPSKGFALISNPSKTYTFSIRIMDFMDWLTTYGDDLKGKITGEDLKDILDISEIKLFNTSPAFHWQGMNFVLSDTFEGSIYPTTIPPTKWNNYKNKHTGKTHGGNQILDKESQRIINQFYFYRNQMAQMLTKKLRSEGVI